MSRIFHKDYCSKCKAKNVPLLKASTTKRKTYTHQYYICRNCNNSRRKEYYKNNTQKCRAILEKSIKKHIYKQEARIQLAKEVRSGRIIKPDCCNICKDKGRIEAHHTDYSKPLLVSWLCSGCHSLMH